MELNPSQLEAIQRTNGPTLIVAGPGSGKTSTLTLRIAYLIREGVAETGHILAITFTQKAAKEIERRVQKLLGEEEALPTISTFHGLAYSIVQENKELLGISGKIEIIAEGEQRKIMNDLLKAHPEVEMSARDLALAISRFKVGQKEAPQGEGPQLEPLVQDYQYALKELGKLDFDDLLIHTIQLLNNNVELLQRYHARYRVIMVDEYQDTSPIQAKLVHMLAQKDQNLFVIGDPDQAIYSFRGADLGNFLQFRRMYERVKEIHLGENYRCPGVIVKASQALIIHNSQRINKLPLPQKAGGVPIQVVSTATPWQEASFIVKTVQRLMGGSDHMNTHSIEDGGEPMGDRPLRDMVVLYRLNSVGKFLAKQFEDAGIPYQMVGERGFFDRKEVKEFLDQVQKIHEDANGGVKEGMPGALPNEHLSEHLRRLMGEFGLKEKYDDGTSSGERKWDHLLQILNIAMTYNELPLVEAFEELYEQAALSRDEDYWDENRQAVTLMTVHAAKGLEFPVVFMAGLEEGLFPYLKHQDGETHLEEERRLFYVGMTRSKERLYLSSSRERMMNGETLQSEPSRFISEIPEEFKELQLIESRKQRSIEKEPSPQMELF